MCDRTLVMTNVLFQKIKEWDFFTHRTGDGRLYWDGIECGIDQPVFISMVNAIVAAWNAKGITGMDDFEKTQKMTPEMVQHMVYREIDSYLCKLLGVIKSN
ncbi:hypothetical protein L211DRAFT_848991 [Terfezia boudieri ATCC MYA-4762]|uniref:Uncharacterized protein n=1 Tax=Terfezia boudieri ATCC MYA-4762 TaxID=1051890 RepID=A0A3N4LN38_9PEZI|nr:hypothetical protein L211DRAFT_848991 [Terfezia boudieri ATCC MYA-4762]